MIKIAFYTTTGQAQRFINKTGFDAHRIEDVHPRCQMNDGCILILPSYQSLIMDSVVDFLTCKDSKENLLGLIECSDHNFSGLSAQTAKEISATLCVSVLYLFEPSGNLADIKSVRQVAKEACKKG